MTKKSILIFLLKRMQVRREWNNIFKVKQRKQIYQPRILYLKKRVIYQKKKKKKKTCQLRIRCPTKIYKIEGAIKTDKIDRIYPQQIHIIRNVINFPLGRRKLT